MFEEQVPAFWCVTHLPGLILPGLRSKKWENFSRRCMARLAGELADGVKVENLMRWGRAENRAHLQDIKNENLEIDFVIQGDGTSVHASKSVSRAFTCALLFRESVCHQISRAIN